MPTLEIIHQVDAEEGYFGGEKIIVGDSTAYDIFIVQGKWQIMKGRTPLGSLSLETRPSSHLNRYLERLLAEYEQNGWTLDSKNEVSEGNFRAHRTKTIYMLSKT